MRIGLHLPAFSFPGGRTAILDELLAVADGADDAGISAISVMDHLMQLDAFGDVGEPMLESYSTLAFLAARTRSVRLLTLVTAVGYRHPAVLVKTVSTLDALSGGRAMLGLGAGWYEREYAAFGVPFAATGERLDRVEEAVRMARHLWRGEPGPFDGPFTRLAESVDAPSPAAEPPIIIGGTGERRTLRLVAELADGCNFYVSAADAVAVVERKLAVLRSHCERIGRDVDDVEKTVLYVAKVPGDVAGVPQFIETLRPLGDLGIDTVFLMRRNRPAQFVGEVAAAIVEAAAEL